VAIPSSELNRIIQAAQKGEETAVVALYQAYSQAVYRYIAYRVPVEEAEDLTAEVFVNMVEALPRFRISEAPFESWLFRIAGSRIADYHRRFTRHPTTELLESTSDLSIMPEEQIQVDQESNELRTALSQLSQEQQDVLLLRFVNHKSHEEVGRILNKSVSAVKTIQHRALTELATLLGSDKKGRHYLRGHHE
jgi:RNA polymerase sigma-70 factor (ECF subfamily)